MIVAFKGNIELVRLYLEAGADIDVANDDGDTPLSLTICANRIETVDFLIKKRRSSRIWSLNRSYI